MYPHGPAGPNVSISRPDMTQGSRNTCTDAPLPFLESNITYHKAKLALMSRKQILLSLGHLPVHRFDLDALSSDHESRSNLEDMESFPAVCAISMKPATSSSTVLSIRLNPMVNDDYFTTSIPRRRLPPADGQLKENGKPTNQYADIREVLLRMAQLQ
jgi:hypothetical protein